MRTSPQPLSRRAFLKLTGLVPLALLAPGGMRIPSEQPNVIVLVFDSLSAAHLSLSGYPRRTTPNLDRFAEQAVVYHRHHSAANFTTPGTASLLTGTYPWTHRAFNLGATVVPPYDRQNLFAHFSATGYHNIAYTHNRLANFLLRQFSPQIPGYLPRSTYLMENRQILARVLPDERRVVTLSEEFILERKRKSSLFLSILDEILGDLHERMIRRSNFPRGLPEAYRAHFLLEQAVTGIISTLSAAPQPFLAYFHLLPPHEPYHTRLEFQDCFEDGWQPAAKPLSRFSQGRTGGELNRLRQTYDEFLAYADAEFGRLLDYLTRSGLLAQTVLVVTSDHGQSFERGIHGHITPVLYEPLVHIPLLVSIPGQMKRLDVHSPTISVDLLPTLSALAGLPLPEWCEGEVMPPFNASPERGRRLFMMESKQNGKRSPLLTRTVSLIQEPWKLVSYAGYSQGLNGEKLYDLSSDPDEMEDLAAAHPGIVKELLAMLADSLQTADAPYFQDRAN